MTRTQTKILKGLDEKLSKYLFPLGFERLNQYSYFFEDTYIREEVLLRTQTFLSKKERYVRIHLFGRRKFKLLDKYFVKDEKVIRQHTFTKSSFHRDNKVIDHLSYLNLKIFDNKIDYDKAGEWFGRCYKEKIFDALEQKSNIRILDKLFNQPYSKLVDGKYLLKPVVARLSGNDEYKKILLFVKNQYQNFIDDDSSSKHFVITCKENLQLLENMIEYLDRSKPLKQPYLGSTVLRERL